MRLFEESHTFLRLDRRPIPRGISPISKLADRSRLLSLEQFVRVSGMVPRSEFFPKSRYSNLWRRLRGGNSPVKPFPDRFSPLRDVRFPRDGEIGPDNASSSRFSSMTRPGCFGPLQMTPFQLQRGRPTCQDLKACAGSLVTARLKSSSDIICPCCCHGLSLLRRSSGRSRLHKK